LHTGQFAEEFHEKVGSSRRDDRTARRAVPTDFPELDRLIAGAKQAYALGLKVNAGHGLNYANLPTLHRVPHLVELNIGHSIVSRAAMVGLETAVKDMLALMKKYRG
jgi:pyridoxine 5-phosphate synthase